MSSVQLAPSGEGYIRREGARIVRRYDRVSDVLNTGLPMFSGINEHDLAVRAELGTEVHKVCHELALTPAPWELVASYSRELRAYGEAWLRFQRDAEFVPWLLEEPLSSDKLAVAGTPDAIGDSLRGPTVIDYTIGSPTKRKRLQTAIYERLWRENTGDRRKFRRIEVHLRADGSYAFRPHRDPNDIYAFVGLLQFHRWKKGA